MEKSVTIDPMIRHDTDRGQATLPETKQIMENKSFRTTDDPSVNQSFVLAAFDQHPRKLTACASRLCHGRLEAAKGAVYDAVEQGEARSTDALASIEETATNPIGEASAGYRTEFVDLIRKEVQISGLH